MIKRPVFLLLFAMTSSYFAPAEPITAQYKQGSMHGFLLVKSPEGKVIAVGDVLQVAEGARIRSRLIFRFRDGSIDEESTVVLQEDTLRLVSDHHVQKGPSFPTPLDVTVHVPTGEVAWRETKGGKTEVHRNHMELPNDLANGIIPQVMQNTPSNGAETKVSYLGNDPKPRIVKLSMRAEGRDRFTVGGLEYFATRYVMHIELGGLAGMIAPMIGKQPADVHYWMITGEVPSCAKMEGAFYLGGPVWTVEQASPVWPSAGEAR